MRYVKILFFLVACPLAGCYSIGHHDFTSIMDDLIGSSIGYEKPFKFDNSGRLIRANFLLAGLGLTHITQNDSGDLIYHFNDSEILNTYYRQEWVGKCLIYMVVEPSSLVIKAWGYDEGGNELSCRTWP